MPEPHDPAWNRDHEQQLPDTSGRPPRTASEPAGAEGQAKTSKTFTDPASGGSQDGAHAPNQAEADQTDGVRRREPPAGKSS